MKKEIFYSQSGEDYLLDKFFGSKPKGFYIDIGAFDGIHLSNSYFFEKAGWDGICIEANPENFKLCEINRPNSVCLNVACVGDPLQNKVKFYQEELGLLSGISPMNDVQERYEKRGLNFSGFREIEVNAMTLNHIIKTYANDKKIDFISIDVEGVEVEILSDFDFKTFSPRVLLVEANTEEEKDELHKLVVEENSYHLGRVVANNVIYVKNENDINLLNKIIIDCDIEKTTHPMGDAYTIHGKALQKNFKKRKRGYYFFKKLLKNFNKN